MSNDFWRTEKRTEPFAIGNTLTQKVKEYIRTWEKRCYFDGIPDEVPKKLHDAGKAPSYKAIAIAILKNDLHLYSLGFRKRESQIVNQFVNDAKAKKRKAEIGPGLFDDKLL